MAFAVIDRDVLEQVIGEHLRRYALADKATTEDVLFEHADNAAADILAAYDEAVAEDGGFVLGIRFQHAELRGEGRELAVAELLRETAERVGEGVREGLLHDSNGARVGEFRLTHPTPDDEGDDGEE